LPIKTILLQIPTKLREKKAKKLCRLYSNGKLESHTYKYN
jgi:hypothetical protein